MQSKPIPPTILTPEKIVTPSARKNPTMSIIPHWREDQKPCGATDVDRIVSRAALEFASSLESIKVSSRNGQDQKLADALIRLAIDDCLGQLAVTGLWGEANRGPSHQFWKIVGDDLKCGWLQTRAREKPLGYAGDHELLFRIIQQICTPDPFGSCFDRYFQAQSAPQAVRERTALAARQLAGSCLDHRADEFHVVGIGCGPALEIDQAFRLLASQPHACIHVTLFDLCGEALAHAEKRLQIMLPTEQLVTIRENLPRLPQRKQIEQWMGRPQLILCPGLFDYLDLQAATKLLRLFYQQLAEGGVLLVGNFAPDHATRAYMEWIGNWYLTYRSFTELQGMALEAGIPENCLQIGTESTGTDWFLSIRK